MDKASWIVYGSSPFIRNIEDKIPYLFKKYRSIGINVFPFLFKKCEYWIFNDNGIFTNLVKKNYCGEKLIVNKHLESELKMEYLRSGQCIIANSFLIEPYYLFEGVSTILHSDTGKLLYLNSSVLSAINFALIKGAKRVFLAGIDLIQDWDHFYGERGGNKDPHYLEMIKRNIELFNNYIDVIKLNKYANIDVDFVDISKL